jgi:hypothetical protein
MIPPIVLAMVAGLLLLILEGATNRGLLTACLLFPFFYLGAEVLARRISLDDTGISISKLLRSVRIQWSEVESLDAVKSGSKLFLIIQPADRRPALVTNTLERFGELARGIIDRIPESRITETARELSSDPPTKSWPMVQAWIVCLVISGIVAGKFLGY